MESIVPIGAQLGAQDTPSVNQGATCRPAISNEQTMQSTQRYGTLPYVSGPPSTAPLPYAAMPAMSARPTVPMGYYGQGNQFAFMPNPNWMTEREHMLQQQLLQERQQFEAALRASQAQPQPQPPISSFGLPPKVGDDVDINVRRSASILRELDLKTRPLTRLNVQGLLQHLADPPLPRGTTLGGLLQPLGHLRPVPNGLSIR